MNYFFKQYSVWLRCSSSAGRLCICCHEIRLFFTSREFYCLWRGVLELESMAVVFCFLFKNIQREKEREGLSNFCSLPFKGYANTSLLRGGGEIQGGCPHGLTSHSAYTFSFSFFFFNMWALLKRCSTLDALKLNYSHSHSLRYWRSSAAISSQRGSVFNQRTA